MKDYRYKETTLSWLPQIPDHWEWRFLSQASYERKEKNAGNEPLPVLSLSYGNIIRKKDIKSPIA